MKTSLKLLAAPAIVATCVLSLIIPVANAQAEDKLRLDHGHTDIFNVTAQADALTLNLKEDVTGSEVKRQPEDVTLVVKKTAYEPKWKEIPEVGAAGYYLPAVQKAELLWPGWDTLEVSAEGFNGINLNFISVDGPGRVWLLGRGQFSGFQPLLKDGKYNLTSGSVREQSYPAHTHADWVFEKPGHYTMKVNATGMKDGKLYTSNTATYKWEVEGTPAQKAETPSDKASSDTASQATPEQDKPSQATPEQDKPSQATPEQDEAAKTDEPVVEAPSVKTETPEEENPIFVPTNDGKHTDSAPATQPKEAAQVCFAHKSDVKSETLVPRLKDDRQTPARMVNPASVSFLIGDAGKTQTNQAVGSIPAGQTVWMIGATQVANVPWLGANTMTESVLTKTTGAVTWTLKSFNGPGKMEVFTSGNFGKIVGNKWFNSNGGSVTIPRNTHVHPNWVFSAPGTYRVGITQTAHAKNGAKLVGHTILTFHVGSGSGISSGHFDLGSEVGSQSTQIVYWKDAQGKPCVPSELDQKRSGISYRGQGTSTVPFGSANGKELAKTGSNNVLPILGIVGVLWILGGAFILASNKRKENLA